MRYVASREEMQQIDAYSINTMGIPGIVLMEKAAACFRRSLFREEYQQRVMYLSLRKRAITVEMVWHSGVFC